MSLSKTKYLCYECVGDHVLKDEILAKGLDENCSYCDKTIECCELEEIADRAYSVLSENYISGTREKSFSQKSDYSTYWKQHGHPPNEIFMEMMEVNKEIAGDIVSILSDQYDHRAIRDGEDGPFSGTVLYERKSFNAFGHAIDWVEFCGRIKHHSRFFSPESKAYLDKIFNDIKEHQKYYNKPGIKEIGASSSERFVFRARQVSSNNDDEITKIGLNGAKELGSPPPRLTSPGRMNASGIPVFYGSFERKTCVSEIRVPVGGLAITGKFEIIRPIRVLDLTLFEKEYLKVSEFDPVFTSIMEQQSFLEIFQREISKPILPNDESLEYIPTQVIVEYLSNQFQPKLDGLIFYSSQTNNSDDDHLEKSSEKNIILFNHAIKVEDIPTEVNPKETESYIYKGYFREKDNEFDIVKIPRFSITPMGNVDLVVDNSDKVYFEYVGKENNPPPFLRLVENSLQIHKILSVRHELKTFDVSKRVEISKP